jgi:hypothetical protein
MKIQGGVYKELLSDFKKAYEGDNRISAAENRKVLAKGVSKIKAQFKNAKSEKGLAAARNALAKTYRAADKNWNVTTAAQRVATGFLGPNLDGKGGSLAAVEQKLRNAIDGSTVSAS